LAVSLVAKQVLQNRYEVVRSIKAGGMGAVYEAIDHKLADTPCAIKEVLTAALEGPDADYILRSFESEMRSLAVLNHPNIPRVRDYFELAGQRYIILDLIRGTPLDDELQRHLEVTGSPMEPAIAVADMVEVLETLAYLHSGNPAVVHRDIKPANLIRDERDRRIKLVDFGIARAVGSQQLQTMVGTLGYCAPEQMAGRAEPRSDVYSVGATLAHLITGRLSRTLDLESLTRQLPQFPELAAILARATEMKLSLRYSSASEMAAALKQWLQGPECGTGSPTSAGAEPEAALPRPQTVATRPAREPLSPALMAGGVVALLLTSILLFWSTPKGSAASAPGRGAGHSPSLAPQPAPTMSPATRPDRPRPIPRPRDDGVAAAPRKPDPRTATRPVRLPQPPTRPALLPSLPGAGYPTKRVTARPSRLLPPAPAAPPQRVEGFERVRSQGPERVYRKAYPGYTLLLKIQPVSEPNRAYFQQHSQQLSLQHGDWRYGRVRDQYWGMRLASGSLIEFTLQPAPAADFDDWSSLEGFLRKVGL
jgi:serine/threonine protein kinase